jgi:hypothetical protein
MSDQSQLSILTELVSLYKQIDEQQERTIKAQADSINILMERGNRQRETILHQRRLIAKLYDEIDMLHDSMEVENA